MKKTIAAIAALLTFTSVLAAERETTLIEDWSFYPAYDVSHHPKAEQVKVPHTWNNDDVYSGMKYERTTYMYEHILTCDTEMLKKRVFLRFNAVNSYAELAVNQHYVGHHAGGYTAFCFEITDFLKEGENKLSLLASNAYRTDVAPLAGDFNIYGGITRPVELIITDTDCISPLDQGSVGVYVHQLSVSKEKADIEIETMLSMKSKDEKRELTVTILDEDGQTVATADGTILSDGDQRLCPLKKGITISNPRLWNGRKDPHLYKLRVELKTGDGKTIDKVEDTFGLRYFSCDAEKGFFLNGEHLDLHGVCRHEEGPGTASLYNEKAMQQDADIIAELGSTGVRFVHYPHSRYDVRMYDERGIVVWYELNLAGPGGYNSPGYVKHLDLEKNVMLNLEEMIKQNYNSPSICFWSLCNELSFKYDEPATFLRKLHNRAKELDPQRLTTLAICYSQDGFQGITDTFGWNKYFGYYENKGGVGEFMDQAHREAGSQPVGLCEYGAAGSPNQHGFEKKVTNKIHYEENQARVHEENWRDMATRPYAWCKFIWQYADNPSSIRDEGDGPGMNDKGIVTYDRKTKKDAYWFYKANWSSEPVLYIAARRYTDRTEQTTPVKVYTNQKQVTLWVNGKRIGKAKADETGRAMFDNVTLSPGANTITVKAGKLTDSCTCNYDPAAAAKQDRPATEEKLDGAVN